MTKKPRYVAYYRVSTAKQGRSGLGLEAQQQAVRTFLNGGNWELIAEFTEVESGKRHQNRAQLAEAMELCRMTGATLLIAKLDRLSRNVAFVSALMETGVQFTACDFPTANNLTIHILAAVAEHERIAISNRTKEALGAAKARGVKMGGFRGHMVDHLAGNAAMAAKADAFADGILKIIQPMRDAGSSLREIAQTLEERRIKTARGGNWTATTVKNVLDRAPQKAA